MGLGGQMHDGVRLEFQQRLAHPLTVGDIGLQEPITITGFHFGERLEVAGVGQLVQVEDAVLGVLNEVADQSRADESGSPGD